MPIQKFVPIDNGNYRLGLPGQAGRTGAQKQEPSSHSLKQNRQSINPICARCSLETAVPRTSRSLLD
jgi:hypothetical protein